MNRKRAFSKSALSEVLVPTAQALVISFDAEYE